MKTLTKIWILMTDQARSDRASLIKVSRRLLFAFENSCMIRKWWNWFSVPTLSCSNPSIIGDFWAQIFTRFKPRNLLLERRWTQQTAFNLFCCWSARSQALDWPPPSNNSFRFLVIDDFRYSQTDSARSKFKYLAARIKLFHRCNVLDSSGGACVYFRRYIMWVARCVS